MRDDVTTLDGLRAATLRHWQQAAQHGETALVVLPAQTVLDYCDRLLREAGGDPSQITITAPSARLEDTPPPPETYRPARPTDAMALQMARLRGGSAR